MLPNESERGGEPTRSEAVVLRKLNLRVEPELGLARCMLSVHVGPSFLPREEVEPIPADAEDGRAHILR